MEFKGFDAGSLAFLPSAERQAVLRDMREIVESGSSLYIGERIDRLQRVLAPYGYFRKTLNALNIVQRTAYGYMYGYRVAVAQLPPGAIKAMSDRKLQVVSRDRNSLGDWSEAVVLVPPPASGSAAVYDRWVEELVSKKKKRVTGTKARRIPRDPDAVLLECYRFIARCALRLPPRRQVREQFARRLIGLTMKHFELAPERFVPEDVPEHFAPSRGGYGQRDAVA